jgi:hypothetical protein
MSGYSADRLIVEKMIPVVLIALLLSCTTVSGQVNEIDSHVWERIIKAGKDLIWLSRHQNDPESPGRSPNDIVWIGPNTFWELIFIRDPIDSIAFTVFDGPSHGDDEAEYLLDIGPYIELRLRYDQAKDAFHILGYTATTIVHDTAVGKRVDQLYDQFRGTLGKDRPVRPSVGLDRMIVGKSKRQEIFTSSEDERAYREIGLEFGFNDDGILKTLYIGDYTFSTAEGIQPHGSDIREVLAAYGEPLKEYDSLDVNGVIVTGIKVLEYQGISFALDGFGGNDQVMMIIVR